MAGGAVTSSVTAGAHIPTKPLTTARLLLLTLSFLGVQMSWSIQLAFATPILRELGVSNSAVSFVWLAGPVSGLLMQPTVGVVSDTYQGRFGRRRPFALAGTIFASIGMLMISNAASLGYLFGDEGSASFKRSSIAIAIVGFWVLDLANNTVQGPLRALLVDVAPPEQQAKGSAFFSFMLAGGNLAGYGAGYLPLATYLPFLKTNTRALFLVGILGMTICVVITCLVIKERPFVRPPAMVVKKNPFPAIWGGIRNMPSTMSRLCLIQFISWLGWFPFLLYSTNWMGENVFGGDAQAAEGTHAYDLYEQGVRLGSLGLMFQSVVTFLYSLVLPRFIKLAGARLVWALGQFVLFLCLCSTVWVERVAFAKTGAVVIFTLTGIAWATTMVVPFSLCGVIVGPAQSGIYMGVLNIFVVLPQLVIAVSVGILVRYLPDISYALGIGGIFSLVCTLTLCCVQVEPATDRVSEAADARRAEANRVAAGGGPDKGDDGAAINDDATQSLLHH